MNKRCSVLGLIISVLVSAENALTVFNNNVLLQSKPTSANRAEHSIVKTKTIFSNNGFAKIDRNVVHNYNDYDEKPRAFAGVSKTNNVVPADGKWSANRFPRQARKFPRNKNNDEDASAAAGGQRIKLLLDVQSERQKDVYDYYDYYDDDDYRGKNVDFLQTDDCELNAQMENDSKPVTRTPSESQERKRCTTTLQAAQDTDVDGRRKSQAPPENKAVLSCRDCKLLTPGNDSMAEPVASGFDSRTDGMDDEYLITVLKQLIDRLNKPDKLTSTPDEDVTVRRSNGGEPAATSTPQPPPPPPEVTGSVGAKKNANGNGSSEEEWILRLEKTKGIMDKPDSSLENIFVNGKWMKNEMTKNETNGCGKKPNADGPYAYDISNGSPAVAVGVAQENRRQELRATAAVPALPEDGLAPYLLLSSTRRNEKYEPVTAVENNEERVTASAATTATEEPFSNNALRTLDDVTESNGGGGDGPKTESAAAPVSGSAENEEDAGSPDSNDADANCRCGDKKIVKNTLSSVMVKNVTETISADAYGRARTSHRRLDGSRANNGGMSAVNSKNVVSAGEPAAAAAAAAAALRNDSNPSRWKTRERTATEIPRENRGNEPKTPRDRKPTRLIVDGSQRINGRAKKPDGVIADLTARELGGRRAGRRKNEEENARDRNDAGGGKMSFSIPSTRRNPRRFGEKREENGPPGRYGGDDRISAAPVNSGGASKPVDRNPPGKLRWHEPRERGALDHGRNDGNGVKTNRRIIDTKPERRRVVPTGRTDAETARRHGDGADGATEKLRSRDLPRVTTKHDVEKFASRRPGSDDVFYDKNKKSRGKLIEPPPPPPPPPTRDYRARNTPRRVVVDKSVGRHFGKENVPRKAAEGNGVYVVKSRKPARSNNDRTVVSAGNAARYADVVHYPVTDGDKRKRPVVRNVAESTKPTESVKNIRLLATTAVNDETVSSWKSKESLNDPRRANADWSAAATTAAAGGYHYDLLGEPTNNARNDDRRSSTAADSRGNHDKHDAVSSKPPPKSSQKNRNDAYDDDDEHAPYTAEHLRPIIFRKSTRKPAVPTKLAAAAAAAAAVVVTTDENRNDLDRASDDGGKPYSAFQVLPRVRVIDGVFNVPLVGRVGHNNGSVSASDVFIPVEQESDGPRHSAVSLAELLTGEFRLLDGHGGGERPAPSEPARDDAPIVQRTAAVPVHVIQIINNGVQCSTDARNCTDERSEKHSDRVRPRSDDTGGGGDDGARSRNAPSMNRRQISHQVKDAYNHFDPEIVDRFLQVYSPPYTV